jgi:hypothetical protein
MILLNIIIIIVSSIITPQDDLKQPKEKERGSA